VRAPCPRSRPLWRQVPIRQQEYPFASSSAFNAHKTINEMLATMENNLQVKIAQIKSAFF
jgi:hypothetical protein